MRRAISVSVLVILLTSVLVPLAQANVSWVPACCRAGGEHHCTGMAGMDGFQSVASKCPYRVAPAVTSGIAALATVSLPVSIFAAECETAALPVCEPLPVAFGNVQKRGPPLS